MRSTMIAAVAAAALAAGCASMSAPGSCDRACLVDLADDYLAALVAHDPSRVPFAEDVVFVENLERKTPGEGLWETVTAGPTDFQILVPDPVTGEVGFIGMMAEDTPTLLAFRLKVRNGAIVEAEHIVSHSVPEANLVNLQTPRAGFRTEIPEGEWLPEAELRRIAASYYDALDDNDGHLAPFAEDCVRFENGGMASTNPARLAIPVDSLDGIGRYGCTDQLSTGVFAYIDTIANRRVFAADPLTGLAIGFSHFHHGMEKKYADVSLPGFPDIHRIAINANAFDLPAAHLFKIGPEGRIHEIEAIGFVAPYDSPTGWE